jgi:RNA-directed DNA polymerase
VLKYGKLCEFPTFQHDKQTTSIYYLSLETKRVYCPAKPSHLTIPSNKGGLFLSFGCAISQSAQTRILTGWKQQNWHRRSDLTLQDIANHVNIRMRGVIRYYGKYRLWTLRGLICHLEERLAKWVLNKYRKFKGSYEKAYGWINEMKVSYPGMFYHWTLF